VLPYPRSGANRKLSEGESVRVYDASLNKPEISREDLLAEVNNNIEATSIWRLTHETVF
jgi:hypothetical protein